MKMSNTYKSIVSIDVMSDINILQSFSDSMIIYLDGYNMMTTRECYSELFKKLDFPDYFGYNLNALYDMLTDLSWLSFRNLTLMIEKSYLLLSSETNEDREVFLEILEDVAENWAVPINLGETWDRSAVVFRTILVE